MFQFSLDLKFRGDRGYLQGTSLHDAILEVMLTQRPEAIHHRGRLVFHSLLRRQPDFFLGEPGETMPEPHVPSVKLRIDHPSGKIDGWMVESERQVLIRSPYDEEAIIAATRRNGSVIRLEYPPPFSAIETAVAMTKALHNAVLALSDRKWIFTRLDFPHLLTDSDLDGLAIELVSNLHGRLTKSLITNAKGDFGDIYFSAV